MNFAHTYSACPVCASTNTSLALTCKDYTVSKELFEIWECSQCTLRFTQAAPGPKEIGPYYQSDAYISHSDSGKGIVNKLYKLARLYTIGRKRHHVQLLTG